MAKQQEKPGAASKAVHPDVEELMAHLEPTQNIGNLSRLGLPNEVVEKELNKALKIIVERRVLYANFLRVNQDIKDMIREIQQYRVKK